MAGGAADPGGAHRGWAEGEATPALDRDCRQVAAAAVVLAVLFVLATVFMIGKP